MGRARRLEFGDFQTPPALANRVVGLLRSRGLRPGTILEPTCGTGAFVGAALTHFREAAVVAFDVNPDYVRATAALTSGRRLSCGVANVFTEDWQTRIREMAAPLLILGNPPWVTASALGALRSANLPVKSNFQSHRGLDALTGKSNFDVAEWMVLRLLDAAWGHDVTLAMLLKTSVARRILSHLWSTDRAIASAEVVRFDAAAAFGVNADACLFVCRPGQPASKECSIGTLDQAGDPHGRIAWRDGALVSDPVSYDRHRALLACAADVERLRWRSGVKHDCASVMELRRERDGAFVAAAGQRIELEPDYVFPLVKSTDVARGQTATARRWMIVTQRLPGDDTSVIAQRAPRTWRYLCVHGERLDARRSSIYRNRPRFSVFGVGPYTFAPWKVAVSALHKHLTFSIVGPIDGRPAVLDDACYHLSCETEAEARSTAALLEYEGSRALLRSLIFWDAKRPITSDVLQRLDLRQVAELTGRARFPPDRPAPRGVLESMPRNNR